VKRNQRCQAVTKQGTPCHAFATEGGLCFFHANPRKASELGRIGGKANRHVSSLPSDPLADMNSITAVRDTVSRLISEVYSGQLNPRTAAGLAPLMSLQLRVLNTTQIEERLERVERRLAESEAGLEKIEAKKEEVSSASLRMRDPTER
jgi:hypothetical protein